MAKEKGNAAEFQRRKTSEPPPGWEPALANQFSQREEFYRAILDSLGQGVVITDA